MFNADELDESNDTIDVNQSAFSKHDVIGCLSIGGRWVTCQYGLQVRNCSLS